MWSYTVLRGVIPAQTPGAARIVASGTVSAPACCFAHGIYRLKLPRNAARVAQIMTHRFVLLLFLCSVSTSAVHYSWVLPAASVVQFFGALVIPAEVDVDNVLAASAVFPAAVQSEFEEPVSKHERNGVIFEEFFDDDHQLPYYFNTETGSTSWELPDTKQQAPLASQTPKTRVRQRKRRRKPRRSTKSPELTEKRAEVVGQWLAEGEQLSAGTDYASQTRYANHRSAACTKLTSYSRKDESLASRFDTLPSIAEMIQSPGSAEAAARLVKEPRLHEVFQSVGKAHGLRSALHHALDVVRWSDYVCMFRSACTHNYVASRCIKPVQQLPRIRQPYLCIASKR